MSKDFGIAGLRIGFMETQNDIIYDLKNRFGTWSINNLAVELLSIISETSFLSDYEFVRKKYLKDKNIFYQELLSMDNLKVFPSDANFFLLQMQNDVKNGYEFIMNLLVNTGLYLRSMEDKIGLDASFIRVACRSREENAKIIAILKDQI